MEELKEGDEVVDMTTGQLGYFLGLTEEGKVKFSLMCYNREGHRPWDWTLNRENVVKTMGNRDVD